MERRFLSLKEIEGVVVHDTYLKRELEKRAPAFVYLRDLARAAAYIGGELIPSPPVRCDWMMKKVFFEGVECYLLYQGPSEEFPASLRAVFAGEGLSVMKGEDLAVLTVATVNHLLRFIRESNPGEELPDICASV